MDELFELLASYDIPATRSEELLHDLIVGVLAGGGVRFEREFVFNAASRVDFWLPDYRVAIEVKVDGGVNDVLAQCHRYGTEECVDGVLLITTRRRHCVAVELMAGKEFRVFLVRG